MMLLFMLLTLALCQTLSVSGQTTSTDARYQILEKLLYTRRSDTNQGFDVTLSTFYLDSLDARKACNRLGGKLVEIRNRRKFQFIVGFLESLPVIDQHVIHISGRESNGEFVFNSQGQLPYLDWHRQEPNLNDGEECLAIERRNGRFRMNNIPCKGLARRYLCDL